MFVFWLELSIQALSPLPASPAHRCCGVSLAHHPTHFACFLPCPVTRTTTVNTETLRSSLPFLPRVAPSSPTTVLSPSRPLGTITHSWFMSALCLT
ncbi:hypothetical protein BT67DRAFT_231352 [Trichocladium antarcticum]|uniref:Secreted protein n=1 Tax=Trichocladium antarcticum TaxID=1450529 RepID=A0AAN6UNL3_9PEZI|nr:hypothetical protein BT67DRAFT_231352 [Trichocladium antarcticum]